jgi:hypothetical protein
MSILTKLARTVTLAYTRTQLLKLGKPYGVTRVEGLETHPGGAFEVQISLESDSSLYVTGTVSFANNRASIRKLNTGRAWLDKVAALHLVGKPLPLDAEQVRKLQSLWPS